MSDLDIGLLLFSSRMKQARMSLPNFEKEIVNSLGNLTFLFSSKDGISILNLLSKSSWISSLSYKILSLYHSK